MIRVRADVLDLLDSECARGEHLWPGHTCSDDIPTGSKLAMLMEEVGEVARELCEEAQGRPLNTNRLRKELVQVAAVAAAWVESLL